MSGIKESKLQAEELQLDIDIACAKLRDAKITPKYLFLGLREAALWRNHLNSAGRTVFHKGVVTWNNLIVIDTAYTSVVGVSA